MELLLSWQAPIWVTVTSYDSSAMRLTALLHAVEKKKGGDLVVAKIRASHLLAKTGGVLLVHVLRQVKPYIYIYICAFVPWHPFCTDSQHLLRHNATVEIRRIHSFCVCLWSGQPAATKI